ncbi:MAG: BlaI/MecI/CopY family transcriptional regulator [Terracidiphilus sp.]
MAGRRKGTNSLTPLELKIMHALWNQGPSSVTDVREHLSAGDDLAYNTVQTMLNVLCRKGRVRRDLKQRAYVYRAVAKKETVLRNAVRDLVERMFSGSPEELVMSLIKTNQVDAKKIAELSRRLAAEEGGERNGRR